MSNRCMTTPTLISRKDLAALLHSVNVKDVAKHAAVSTKTVYRLRKDRPEDSAVGPSLEMAEKLIAAVRRIKLLEASVQPAASTPLPASRVQQRRAARTA